MKIARIALIIVLSTPVAASAASDLQAWAVSGTTRLLRGAPAEAGTRVELAAARNEWESFQVFVRADGPVKGVNLVAGDLSGPGGSIIGGKDAVLYREHQLEIAEPSHRNDRFTPGWYPDALIPFLHPLTRRPLHGGKFSAAPFDLPGGETHGFWVDVRVPTEARAGAYRGRYRITDAAGDEIGIEVVLTVWDFELPRVASFQTALGSPGERLRRYYALRAKNGKEQEPQDWEAVDAQIADELCRHRINATPPPALLTPRQTGVSYDFTSEQIAALRRFVDTYNINALQVPHPRTAIKDPVSESATLGAWLKSFELLKEALARPAVTFFTYLKDEPNSQEEYQYVQKWGAAIRAIHSPVKVLVVEQTKSQDARWGTLYGAVDIWCPLFPLHDEETASQRLAAGETLWTYTALCQRDATPWWQIDFPLLNYRVPAWIAWHHHMQGLLYWGGMCHWSGVQDPWTDPKTLDRRKDGKGPLYQGEGSLLYPGRQIGYDGVTPSMRLKALRDGIEDFEYLKVLERKGLADAARAIVMPLAPSWFKWNGDPSAYGRARIELAKMISADAGHERK